MLPQSIRLISARILTSYFAIAIVVSIMAIGLMLRLYPLFALPPFVDEATHMVWANEIWVRKTRESLFLADLGKLLYIWISALLIGIFADPLTVGRMVSVVTGTLSIFGVYVLAKQLFRSYQIAAFAATCYALMPLAVFHERMALVDPTLSALILWAVVAGNQAVATKPASRRTAFTLLSGLLLAAAMLTKQSAVVFSFVPALIILLSGQNKQAKLQMIVQCYIPFGIALLVALVAPSTGQAGGKTTQFLLFLSTMNANCLDLWATNAGKISEWLLSYISWPALLAVLVACVLRWDKRLLLLLCYTFIPLLFFELMGVMTYSRYIVPCAAPLCILIAIGIQAVATRLAVTFKLLRRKIPLLSGVILLIVACPWISFNTTLISDPIKLPLPKDDRVQYINGWTSGFGMAEAFSIVNDTATNLKRPVILLTNPWLASQARLYFLNSTTVHPREEMAVYWGLRSIVLDWQVHKVMTFVLTVEPLDNWQRLESNNPEFKLYGTFPKPDGSEAIKLYAADFGEIVR